MSIKIDADRHMVTASGKTAALSPKQFEILKQLAKADGKVLSRERIAELVWGLEYRPSDMRTIDQHIARLRGALGKDGASVLTVTGAGYRLIGKIGTGARAIGKVLSVEREFGKQVVSTIVIRVTDLVGHISKGSAVSL